MENILKVTDSHGKETYSITVKKVFEAYENRYFENLHIYQKDGEFTSVLFKYDAADDFKKYDPTTFTGSVDAYDKEGNHIAFMEYVNGQRVHIKYIMSFSCWEILIWGDGNYAINSWCGGSGSSGNGGNSSGNGNSGNGNHGNGGAVIAPNPPSQLSMSQFICTRLQIRDPNRRHGY